MLLEELSSILPPKVLGTQLGRFYAELCLEIRKLLQQKDQHVYTSVTVNFDAEQFSVMFFFTFQARPKPRIPSINALAKSLLKKHKLKLEVLVDKTLEDEDSWTYDIDVNLSGYFWHNKDSLDAVSDAAKAAFETNAGDLDYVVHT